MVKSREQKLMKNKAKGSKTYDSAILLRFECTVNPQNLMKINGADFEKMEFFFLT